MNKYYVVDALVRGFDRQMRRRSICVAHQMINGGLSVPSLEPCFSSPYALKGIEISGSGRNILWRAYFQPDPTAAHLTASSVEFALFFVDRETHRFIDVGTDEVITDYMVLQCVLHSLSWHCAGSHFSSSADSSVVSYSYAVHLLFTATATSGYLV